MNACKFGLYKVPQAKLSGQSGLV